MAQPPPPPAPAPAPDVPFTKLTHEITQLVYRDLHATLDSMTDMEPSDRRERLLDYAARTKHRIVRLLVAVRWHMECSAFHSSARTLADVANGRSAGFTGIADTLCHVREFSKMCAGHPSAVAYSAELLGPRMTAFRMPRFIETAIDTVGGMRAVEDTLDDDPYAAPVRMGSRRQFKESEAEMRLRLETKFAVRRALPDGVSVLHWNPDPNGVSVRVGIPNVWHAEVMLNAPNVDDASFVLVEFKLLVRTHMDAGGAIRRMHPVDGEPIPMTADHYNYLRNMIQDRMMWAAHDAKPPPDDANRAAGNANPTPNKANGAAGDAKPTPTEANADVQMTDAGVDAGVPSVEVNARPNAASAPGDPPRKARRSDASLRCLCLIMTRELCTTLVMEYVREQAAVLHLHPAWKNAKLGIRGIGSEEGAEVPVTIHYWKMSSFAASVAVQVPKDDADEASDWPEVDGRCADIVDVVHNPPTPKRADVSLDLLRVNLEDLLLETTRARAQQILGELSHAITSKTKGVSETAIAAHGASTESLLFDVGKTGFGLYISISLCTGAFRVRVRGGTSFALKQRVDKCVWLRRLLWTGEKHFAGGLAGLERELSGIIALVLECLQISSCVRQTAMIDEGALVTWPPGPAAVPGKHRTGISLEESGSATKPPLMPIEPSRPMRFLFTNVWHATDDHSAFFSAAVPPDKRNRQSPVSYTTAADGLCFIQGKIPHGTDPVDPDAANASCSAAAAARWGELRHATQQRFRRDRLLRYLYFEQLAMAKWPDYELKSSERTPLRILPPAAHRASARHPELPIVDATLVLSAGDAWRVEMTLSEDTVFDDDGPVHALGVRFSAENRSLFFSYASAEGIDVRCFGRDLLLVRAAASLSVIAHDMRGSFEQHGVMTVRQRTPARFVAEGTGTVVRVGAVVPGFRDMNRPVGPQTARYVLTLARSPPARVPELARYIAEVLNCSKTEDVNVVALLMRALPVVACAERARRFQSVHAVTVRTALRLRIEFVVGNLKCGLEVDGRYGTGHVQLGDTRRAYDVGRRAGRTQRNESTEKFAEIPAWERMLEKLGKHGKVQYEGCSVVVWHHTAESVVAMVVGEGVTRGG